MIARPVATVSAPATRPARRTTLEDPTNRRLLPPITIQQERGSVAAHGGPHERCRNGTQPSSSLVPQAVVLAGRRRLRARAPSHPGNGGALSGLEHGTQCKATCGHLNTPTRSCVSTCLDSPSARTVAPHHPQRRGSRRGSRTVIVRRGEGGRTMRPCRLPRMGGRHGRNTLNNNALTGYLKRRLGVLSIHPYTQKVYA